MRKTNCIVILILHILFLTIINHTYFKWINEYRQLVDIFIMWLPFVIVILILTGYSLILHNKFYKKVWKYTYLNTFIFAIGLVGILFLNELLDNIGRAVMNLIYVLLLVSSELVECYLINRLEEVGFSRKQEWIRSQEIQKIWGKKKYQDIERRFTILEISFILLGIVPLQTVVFYLIAVILMGIGCFNLNKYAEAVGNLGINKTKVKYSCCINYSISIIAAMFLYPRISGGALFICLYSGLLIKYYWNCVAVRILYEAEEWKDNAGNAAGEF